ncbi:MAG: hypothetical protein IJO03_11710 [Clostridia bacterium]|nr:hypothetical protein [Clostridia bacterium]MBQ7122916.1 hypothetical protein [Clostridia bacterium]
MSGFIEDFYYGNIEPQECCSELKSKLKKKLNSLTEKEESLTSRLSGEEKDLFVAYTNTYNDFLTVSIADSFISGFRLGAKFTLDTFVTD